jgi:hypothetical protein
VAGDEALAKIDFRLALDLTDNCSTVGNFPSLHTNRLLPIPILRQLSEDLWPVSSKLIVGTPEARETLLSAGLGTPLDEQGKDIARINISVKILEESLDSAALWGR